MKKLILKNLLNNELKKHEISIEEISDIKDLDLNIKNKYSVSEKKVCKYFVKEQYLAKDIKNFKNWLLEGKKTECKKKQYILKNIDPKMGKILIICKSLGELFVICGNTVFKILYVNKVRVNINLISKK